MQVNMPAARRLAQLPERYADGGAVGFGARGLSQLRDLVPKMAAMGYSQQAAAPAPAPVSDPRAAQLMAMIPQIEAMGFKQKPQMLARGGMVRGPGSGTSDSIPDEVEPDTFIMPADSTAAIGPSALEKMGTVPVRLSDGEFKIPPEKVMAIGEAVLKLMKDATHTPVNGVDGGQTDAEVEDDGARGFNPADRMAQMPQMYADGGMVDPNRPRSFGDAAAVANDPATTQVRTSAMDSFGRPPATAPAAAPASALGSNLAAVTRMGSFTDPRSTMYDSNPYAASNAAKLAASGQSSRATVEAGMAPAPQPATASNSFGDASAATRDAGVTQVAGYQPGRGTVSTVPAQPVAPRPPAAPALAAAPAAGFQTAAQRMAAPTPAPAPVQAAAPAAPMGWAERNAQRNAEVSAASITNRPEWNRAAGFQPRRFADGGMVEDDLQKRLMQIPSSAPPGWTGGGGGSGGGGGAGGVTGSWDAPQAAPAPAPAPTQPAGALTRAASMSAPAPAVQAMSSMPANPNGGQVSAQSMGAADSLVRRGAADAMAQMPSTQAPVQAPMVRHSGNDWQARKDLENARTSALSITNRPEWSNTGMNRFRGGQAGPSPDVAAYNAMLSNDLALRGAQPGLDQAAMRENAENQRSSLRERGLAAQALASERGAMDRTLITERGNNTRAGIAALGATEAARLRAQQEGKAPPGYRFTANGNMEAIPGGPADLRQNKEGVQQGKDTQDIFSILNEARPLMENATGSYGGVALDKVGQAVGYATEGAKATAQLKALQGALVSKMPKMSGPQSDKDVQLYREMAGQIGDPTIPVEQRKAAMSTIENLNIKYLPAVTDAAGYDSVPSGSYYKTPSGDVRRKQ